MSGRLHSQFDLAYRTGPGLGAPDGAGLEYRLSALVEARLAEVVQGLRADWIAGGARRWGELYPIRELVLTEVDQRVAGALVQGFLQFSQFLAGFEVFLLELKELGVVREQTILSLEKLLVEPRYRFCDQVEVAQTDCGAGNVLGGIDRSGQ